MPESLDEAALSGAIERHLPDLRRYVRAQAGDFLLARESAADLIQSACREVLAGAGRLEWQGDLAFKRYLYTTALRKIIDRKRYWLRDKRRSAGEVRMDTHTALNGTADQRSGATWSPSGAAIREEDLDALRDALERLPDEQRELIAMRRIRGLETDEIAAELGITENAVRSRLSRALARLAALLAP